MSNDSTTNPGHRHFIFLVRIEARIILFGKANSELCDDHLESETVDIREHVHDRVFWILHKVERLLTMFFNATLQEGKNLSLPISVVDVATGSSFSLNF